MHGYLCPILSEPPRVIIYNTYSDTRNLRVRCFQAWELQFYSRAIFGHQVPCYVFSQSYQRPQLLNGSFQTDPSDLEVTYCCCQACNAYFLSRQRRIRMLLVECRLQGWVRADCVLRILNKVSGEEVEDGENVTLEDVVEAVRNCDDFHSACNFLKQECQICYNAVPRNKVRPSTFTSSTFILNA